MVSFVLMSTAVYVSVAFSVPTEGSFSIFLMPPSVVGIFSNDLPSHLLKFALARSVGFMYLLISIPPSAIL